MNEILTVMKAVELSEKYLKEKGVEEARANAELLLADVLHCKRLELYLQFDKPLSEKEKNIYRNYLSRRAKGEPLQYITGEVEFYGIKLKVNPSVLIPRPETELLVEKIIKENGKKENLKILDVGTGSGNIAIALKKNIAASEVYSIDISPEAIETAKENVAINGLENGIVLETFDILNDEVFRKFAGFDIVVSNPPYIPLNELENLQREIKDFEPKEALTDGNNGLSFFKRIAEVSKTILKKGGKIYFEIGIGEEEKVGEILKNNGFVNIETEKDFSGIVRIVKGELL